jgi:hypothetical protein
MNHRWSFRAAARVERLVLKALPNNTIKQRVGDNALHLARQGCPPYPLPRETVHWPVSRNRMIALFIQTG